MLLEHVSRWLIDPEQEKVRTEAPNLKIKTTRHVLESTENMGTLQSPLAGCLCESIYSERLRVLLQYRKCP
jgi:hypothetical protein